jgi:hypothetical protein
VSDYPVIPDWAAGLSSRPATGDYEDDQRALAGVGERHYVHPSGATITVHPDGSMTSLKAAGKRKTTTATPEKLAAGHGLWKEVG